MVAKSSAYLLILLVPVFELTESSPFIDGNADGHDKKTMRTSLTENRVSESHVIGKLSSTSEVRLLRSLA